VKEDAYRGMPGDKPRGEVSPRDADPVNARPCAFLPADSTFPAVDDFPVTDTSSHADMAYAQSLMRMLHAARTLRDLLESEVVLLPDLATRLSPLRQAVGHLAHALGPTLDDLAQRTDAQTSALATAVAVAGEVSAENDQATLTQQYVIYDRYFNVFRLPTMTSAQFTAQVIRSCQRVVDDLPYALLNCDEVVAIVQAVGEMAETLSRRFYPLPAAFVPPTSALTKETRGSALSLSSGSVGGPPTLNLSHLRTHRMAFERWRGGHHLFACSLFCCESLRRADDALKHGHDVATGQHLRHATVFLRGTTAAMWYAGNFPQVVYQQVIRPSMVSAQMPHGFSGTQNADYHRLKAAKAHLQDVLLRRYGRSLTGCSPAIRGPFIMFHETDLADTEAHTQIIISKTGLDQSLTQKEEQAQLPANAPRLNAVAMMRAITDERRQEFEY